MSSETSPQPVPIEAPALRMLLMSLGRFIRRARWLPAVLAAAVLLIFGNILSPGYASWANVNAIFASAAVLAAASMGQTMVMVSGDFGIDLSIGQVMSLTAVLSFVLMNNSNARIPLAILVSLGIGAALGALNGAGVALLGLPALVMTLGTMTVAQGLTFAYTQGGSPTGDTAPWMLSVGLNSIGRIRWIAIGVLAWILLVQLALRKSRYGRMLYLLGSNRNAALLAGVPVRRYVFLTYTLSGLLSGFAGFVLLSFAGTANLDLGGSYLLPTIAAAVIGGTSLSGGEGTLVRTAIGAVTYSMLSTVLIAAGWNVALQEVVSGLLLLLLLLFNARTPALRS